MEGGYSESCLDILGTYMYMHTALDSEYMYMSSLPAFHHYYYRKAGEGLYLFSRDVRIERMVERV